MMLVGGILYQVAVVRMAPVQLGMLVEKSVLKGVEAAQFLVACSMEKRGGPGNEDGMVLQYGHAQACPHILYCKY